MINFLKVPMELTESHRMQLPCAELQVTCSGLSCQPKLGVSAVKALPEPDLRA
jgi:hypothetical protein